MKIFKSKVSLITFIPLVVFIYMTGTAIYYKNILQFFVGFTVTALGIYFFYNLKYIIEDEDLIVRMGFITETKIPIKSIRKIEKSRALTSAPALSIDRLLIRYNSYDELIISPKDKLAFCEALKMINAEIEIVL